MHTITTRPDPSCGASDCIHLTHREVEVLDCLAEGLTNKEVGRLLQVTEGTVKTHLLNIYGKLGAGDRTEAVVKAFRRGLISL